MKEYDKPQARYCVSCEREFYTTISKQYYCPECKAKSDPLNTKCNAKDCQITLTRKYIDPYTHKRYRFCLNHYIEVKKYHKPLQEVI
jgi:predicted RNA-binding Zn-ribbon protein involved in translation (DUF1610 family)